jgi:hypothetical protein
MATNPTEALLAAVRTAASSFGARLSSRPELTDESFLQSAAFELVAALQGDELSDVNSGVQLPTVRQAWSFDTLPQVLLVATPDLTDEGEPHLAPLFLWLGLVRARLAPTEAADLTAFIVAPNSPQLNSLHWAAQLERDPRFCRKLVWLPTPEETPNTSPARFLERTFLAQPWSMLSSQDPRNLNPLTGIAAQVALTSSLNVNVINSWLQVLADSQITGSDLSEALVQLLLREMDLSDDLGSNG